jgi:hypothetical protein
MQKKSTPWHRVVLGAFALGFLGLTIAAVIIASHGLGAVGAGAVFPWLAKGIGMLTSYAGFSATAAVTGVAVGAGMLGVVAATPPEVLGKALHKFTGFCKGLWNKCTGKSGEVVLVGVSSGKSTDTAIMQKLGVQLTAGFLQPQGKQMIGSLHQAARAEEKADSMGCFSGLRKAFTR